MSIARVGLSIDVGSDPIRGSVVAGERTPEPFCGWVELAAAIEAVRLNGAAKTAPGVEPEKS